MSIEQRLVEALHDADPVEPSPDLFARLERSIEEDRAFRRRRLTFAAILAVGAGAVTTWIAFNLETGLSSQLVIDSWKVVVAFLFVAGGVIVGLAPHIRRFARSYVDDVFHLSPDTGGHFLSILDIAYYLVFVGLVLVDADLWKLGDTLRLDAALEDFVGRLAFLLLAMGVLHALNIAFLPVIGVVYNSIVRRVLRVAAGESAPRETLRARTIDRHARSFAVAVAVLVAAIVFSLILSAPGLGSLF